MVAKLINKLYRTQDHPLYHTWYLLSYSCYTCTLLRIRTNRSGKPPYMALSQFLSQFTFISQPLVKMSTASDESFDPCYRKKQIQIVRGIRSILTWLGLRTRRYCATSLASFQQISLY
jgi:hypothetical protein